MAGKKIGKNHIVVFQDEEGNVLKTAFVAHGQEAVPPEVPAKMPVKKGDAAHYERHFKEWDQDVSRVEANLVVRAVYETVPKKYLVMYFHENGKPIATETVAYGEAARQECFPEKEGNEEFEYVFSGWNTDLRSIEKDTMAKAVFEEKRRSYPVRFFHENGELLKEERVLYGQNAHAPENPVKQADPMYHYIFEKWDKDFSHITQAKDVAACFSPVYNEYMVRFFEQAFSENGNLTDSFNIIEETTYHYGDGIIYPQLKKKGYVLSWNVHPEAVEQNTNLYAKWQFANPKGRKIASGRNLFEIINPSVENGAVRLLRYEDSAVRVRLPEEVKLGDYYYKIEEIGKRAMKGCRSMKILNLPDNVRVIKKDGLSGCRKLEQIYCGRKLHYIEEKAFRENPRLKQISFSGKELRHISRKAWDGMGKRVQRSL